MQIINLDEKFSKFSDFWSPKIVGELEGYQIKLAKFKDEFVWHSHENEDEFFLVISGIVDIHVRENDEIVVYTLKEGEGIVVPRGVEHVPKSRGISHVLLFEPSTTLNTGNISNKLTVDNLEEI